MSATNMVVKCSQCGARNRIPADRLRDRPVCGKCRNPLSFDALYPDQPVEITDRTFRNEVLDFPGSVAVYFWAPWCGYCQKFTPIVHLLASKFAGRIKFGKLMLDQNPASASQYGVRSVPALVLFKRGKQVDRISGALPQEEVERHMGMLL